MDDPPSLIDRLVAWVDPVRALQRRHARAKMALAGAWNAGRSSRKYLSGWQPAASDANDASLDDLPLIRARSRDMARNTPLALGALNTVVTNAIGTGLMLQARIDAAALGLSDDEAQAWQRNTEREFRLWAETTDCDVTRSQTFYGLQDLALRAALESGDVFALLPMVRRAQRPYALAIQLIEAERVSNPNWAPDTASLMAGVELDSFGAPLAYHIANAFPWGGSRSRQKLVWQRYPAFGYATGRRNVLHLGRKLRPGQVRGLPYLAPVMEPLKQIDRYTEAEIQAAVIDATLVIFIQRSIEMEQPGEAQDFAKLNLPRDAGNFVETTPGESVSTHAPNRPNTGFDPFVQAILRQIGVALELPFEVLVKHFTSSYSAARSALLEAWKFFRTRRLWMAEAFCQPIYIAWLEEAVAMGRIQAPGFFADPATRAAWCGAVWQGDGPGAIDPLREAQAAGERMEIGISTLADEIAAYDGGDWQIKHAQQAREHAAREQAGLLAPGKPAGPPAAVVAQPAEDDATTDPDERKDNARPRDEDAILWRQALAAIGQDVERFAAQLTAMSARLDTLAPRAAEPLHLVINNPRPATRRIARRVADGSIELIEADTEPDETR